MGLSWVQYINCKTQDERVMIWNGTTSSALNCSLDIPQNRSNCKIFLFIFLCLPKFLFWLHPLVFFKKASIFVSSFDPTKQQMLVSNYVGEPKCIIPHLPLLLCVHFCFLPVKICGKRGPTKGSPYHLHLTFVHILVFLW